MRKYFDTILDPRGEPVEKAEIRVKDSAGSEVQLYSNGGGATISQPVLTNKLGYFEFFVADGTYTFDIRYTGAPTRLVNSVEIYQDSTQAADIVQLKEDVALLKTALPTLPGATALIVGDRAVLKNIIDQPAGQPVYLTESGREGSFVWRLGDYSAEVAADENEDFYVEADAVSADTGAWVRSYDVAPFLSSPTGSSLVGFQQSGTGATPRTAQDKFRELALRPEDYGAKGDGATDDTAAFAALETALSSSVSRRAALKAGATYRTARFWVPDGTRIEGNGATIERTAPTADPLVSTGVKCVVEDLNVDGRYGAGVASSSIREIGIAVDDDCTVRRCTATRVYRHGIGNKPVSDKLRYYRLLIEDCYAHDCGANPAPDGSGTGDGIGLANVSDSTVRRCRGDGNARSGVTMTTYDPDTATTDNSLSANVIFEDVTAFENAYATAINAEHVTAPRLIHCRTDGAISFNNSANVYVDRAEAASLSGTGAAHNPVVLNPTLANAARGHEILSLEGDSPTVIGGTVTTTFATPTGNVVQVLPADSKGVVRDVIVIGGNNGFRLNVSDFSGLRSDTAAGLGVLEGPTGSSRNFVPAQIPVKIKGRIRGIAAAIPSTGTWNRGDVLESLTPSAGGYQGWVCVTSGAPGTWKGAGAIEA